MVSVISAFTTPGAVIVAAVIVCLAGVIFSRATRRGGLSVPAAVTVVVAVLGTILAANVEFRPSPEKWLAAFTRNPENINPELGTNIGGAGSSLFSAVGVGGAGAGAAGAIHHWSAIFRTDLTRFKDEEVSRRGSYAGWGDSPYWRDKAITRAPKIRMISHDGDACAVIYNFDGDLSKLELFDNLILKAPYLLLDKPNVLVIGVGGGTDIVNAIYNHARHVTGIELDPYTVKLVKVDQADFAGHIYDRPDVTMIAGEGRSTLRQSQARYDLIELTAVDTLAALSTGAYVLSESYLYTTEAVGDFLDHLTPNGVLSVVEGDYNERYGFPRHTIRELALYVEALHERGIDDPQSRIAVLASAEAVPEVALLLKNSPITDQDGSRIQDFADRMGFQVWALPGRSFDTMHSHFLRATASDRAAALAQAPLNLSPTSDDNPFYYNYYRWRDLGKYRNQIDVGHTLATGQIVLAVILLVAIVSSVLLILLPLFAFQRQGLRTEGKWGFIAFFLGIGLGFMFIEISFVQKFVLFLGYPTYSLTVVLFSLLTYSGIGSLLTGRMRRPPEQRLLPLLACLSVVSLSYLVVLPPLFHAFLGSPFALRVFIASAVLMPLGLVMGMFFPSGIHIVRRGNVNFVPWAWGINGCASVVATVLAVILAMSYGFRVVTLIALASYLAAVLGMRASTTNVADGAIRESETAKAG